MSDQFRIELKRVLGFKVHQAALEQITLATLAAGDRSEKDGAIPTTTTATTKINDILTTSL